MKLLLLYIDVKDVNFLESVEWSDKDFTDTLKYMPSAKKIWTIYVERMKVFFNPTYDMNLTNKQTI